MDNTGRKPAFAGIYYRIAVNAFPAACGFRQAKAVRRTPSKESNYSAEIYCVTLLNNKIYLIKIVF